MTMYKQLRIYDDARDLVRTVAALPTEGSFGDLHNQLQRATLSVASNIAEGAAAGSDRLFAKYLNIARGLLNEALMQC